MDMRAALLQVVVPLGLVAGRCSAETWIVDATAGAGSDFTDIQPAIDVALPGDVVLVLPGSYSAFTLTEALEILGYGGEVIIGGGSPTKIQNVTSGARAVLAGVSIHAYWGLAVMNCTREVVLDDVALLDAGFHVSGCTDVRMRGCTARGRDGCDSTDPFTFCIQGQPALRAELSRVEITESSLLGGDGGDCIPCQLDGGWGGDGGAAILVDDAAEVHVARCQLAGGDGGDSQPGLLVVDSFGGFGGDALRVGGFPYSRAEALVSGQPMHVLQGGAGGVGEDGQEAGGYGMNIWSQSSARSSGVTFLPGPLQNTAVAIDTGATHEIAAPDDPTLRILAPPAAGQNTTFRVTAVPGSQVTMLLGRTAVIVPVPGLAEDRLVVPLRTVNLGTVGSSGTISMNQFFPLAFGVGSVFHAQALVSLPGSDEQRYSNSVPLVLR